MNSKMVGNHLTLRNDVWITFIISTGIPVAWGVMDREDIPTLEAFFKCVKGKVPSAIVNTLMTDDGKHWNQYGYMQVSVLATSYRPSSTCGI